MADQACATGGSAILMVAGGCLDILARWNLAGDLVWQRNLGTSGCPVGTSVSVDASSHDVVVGGWFQGVVDVGTGALTSHGGADDLVVDVLP